MQRQETDGSAERATGRVAPTRLSGAWTAVIVAVVLFILLIVFIAENTRRVEISYFGAHVHAPVAVALLISAVVGALVVLVVGIARITQLRHTANVARSAPPTPAPPPASSAPADPNGAPVPGVEAGSVVADDPGGEVGGVHARHERPQP